MKGLKPKIQTTLRLLKQRMLGETMELAQMIENKNVVERSIGVFQINFLTRTTLLQRNNKLTRVLKVQQEALKNQVSGAHSNWTFKRIIEIKIQNKMAKRLCLYCDEKYSPGYYCKDHTLQV